MSDANRERTPKLDLQETNILAKTKSQFKMICKKQIFLQKQNLNSK